MPNPFLPRDIVHSWSEEIGKDPTQHQSALARVLKDQRRLTRFIEENQEQMKPETAGVSVYLTGVIARLFDKAGGRLRSATWEQVRAAEQKIGAQIGGLLPVDDSFSERARKADRAQPHVLDEALMALFDRKDKQEGEADLASEESFKVYLLLWVITEVLDANWIPGKDFKGESAYSYVHIEPSA